MEFEIQHHDRFTLRQRFTLGINRYEFSVPEEGGERSVCFVEQKRFKFKEDIRFFADDTKQVEVMRIKARQAFDPRARYDVTDESGEKIGEIQKLFRQSLLRSTYAIYDAEGEEIAIATEASLPTALFRRVSDFIPFIGEFLPVPYDFHFLSGERVIGVNRRRRMQLRDTYEIDMSADTERVLDRRLVLAITVGMDALQAR